MRENVKSRRLFWMISTQADQLCALLTVIAPIRLIPPDEPQPFQSSKDEQMMQDNTRPFNFKSSYFTPELSRR